LIDSEILSKVNPPSENRPRRAAPAAVLAVLLLAGCMPSPPPEDAAGPPPAPAPPAIVRRPQTFASLDLPLDPLASKDQLLRSFQPGRRDPFANVIVPYVVKGELVAAGSAGAEGSGVSGPGGARSGGASPEVKDAICDISTIQVTGLIHGAGSSEAIVVNAQGETGSLRPGDRGGRSTSLIPPGCQVQSIDVNAGYLVIAPVKKGRAVKLAL